MENEFSQFGDGGDFEECPPDVECPLGFDVLRAPAKGTFDCVCLSAVAIGKYTHWWNGRTAPCDGKNCSKCVSGSPRRWHSWMAVYSERSQRTFILEVPAGPAKMLADFRSKNGSLRGVGISLHRANGKVNGPVRIGFAKARGDGVLLPASPDVVAMLERMWNSRKGDDPPSAASTLALVKPPDEGSGAATA